MSLSSDEIRRLLAKTAPKELTKVAVRGRAMKAARRGDIVWGERCEKCGIKWELTQYGLEMHHEDYTKPLEVMWLCMSCHRKHDAHKSYLNNKP